MAEFCLDCLNKIMETHYKRYQVKFFSGVDLCENCGKYKKCVARINILGEIADGREARREYKRKYGKPYRPSNEDVERAIERRKEVKALRKEAKRQYKEYKKKM